MMDCKEKKNKVFAFRIQKTGKTNFPFGVISAVVPGMPSDEKTNKRRHSEQFMSTEQTFKTTHAANSFF